MQYLHTFWAGPHKVSQRQSNSGDGSIGLWDFEALTWLASAVCARKHGQLRLVTDTRGREFVHNIGIDWVYNGGISTSLDDIPQEINAEIFWAAGKIYGLLDVEFPCVSLDADAIAWLPVQTSGRIAALHYERLLWPWYKDNRVAYGPYGFQGPEWNWDLQPFNTAVLYFREKETAEFYAQTVIQFMMAYSLDKKQRVHLRGNNHNGTGSDAMIFAEQRLLPMCAEIRGQEILALEELHYTGMRMNRSERFLHLWGAKLSYKLSTAARTAYVNYMISYLLRNHPEARDTLAIWGLDKTVENDRNPSLQFEDQPADPDLRRYQVSIFGDVSGNVWIEDANVDVRRLAKKGELLLPAETLRPEQGSQYELLMAGTEFVQLRQLM